METEKFPLIPKELLEALERWFPRSQYDHTTPPRKIDFESGQQDVIRFLLQVFEEQQSTNL